jgi:hypothetical protein
VISSTRSAAVVDLEKRQQLERGSVEELGRTETAAVGRRRRSQRWGSQCCLMEGHTGAVFGKLWIRVGIHQQNVENP